MPSEHLQRTTPNTLELLGPIIFYKLSRFVPTHIASSDCQSVVASLQEAQGYRRRPFGHSAKGIFSPSLSLDPSGGHVHTRREDWQTDHYGLTTTRAFILRLRLQTILMPPFRKYLPRPHPQSKSPSSVMTSFGNSLRMAYGTGRMLLGMITFPF
jgi:hypothetical protein